MAPCGFVGGQQLAKHVGQDRLAVVRLLGR